MSIQLRFTAFTISVDSSTLLTYNNLMMIQLLTAGLVPEHFPETFV